MDNTDEQERRSLIILHDRANQGHVSTVFLFLFVISAMHLSTRATSWCYLRLMGHLRFSGNTCKSKLCFFQFFAKVAATVIYLCESYWDRKCSFKRDFLLTLINEQVDHQSDNKEKKNLQSQQSFQTTINQKGREQEKPDKQTSKRTENSASYGSSPIMVGDSGPVAHREPCWRFLC